MRGDTTGSSLTDLDPVYAVNAQDVDRGSRQKYLCHERKIIGPNRAFAYDKTKLRSMIQHPGTGDAIKNAV